MSIDKLQAEINKQLFEHVKISNEEMGAVKKDIEVIKTDIAWIKNNIKNLPPWVTIVCTILSGLVVYFLTH